MICGRQHQLIQQGRIRGLLGVKEHGMQSKVIKRTWETLLGLFFKKKVLADKDQTKEVENPSRESDRS